MPPWYTRIAHVCSIMTVPNTVMYPKHTATQAMTELLSGGEYMEKVVLYYDSYSWVTNGYNTAYTHVYSALNAARSRVCKEHQ